MSSGTNQKTLFQSWGATVSQSNVVQPKNTGKKAAAGRRKATPSSTAAKTHPPRSSLCSEIGQGSTYTPECQVRIQDPKSADEDDDDLMVVAVYEAERTLQLDANFDQDDNPVGTDSTALSPVPSGGQCYPDFPGFDSSSAKVWIYPSNYPIREYQLKISEAALFQNTLVCLPTGLGKTFIASVVMYNFYRWYPSGKIVFMAPTKPLVAQQIEACYKVMGIPQTHMAELTGSTAARQRQELWRAKRVFFLTPQVMVNDLSRDTCPALQVKCVVIDEAHKALGNHAYCQVVRQLGSQTRQFRILALSATPGGDTKSVQQVISNLLISHIELRSEESPDIQAHSHQRSVEKVVVPLGEVVAAHQTRYLQVLEKFMSRLVQNRVMGHKDLRTLTKYQIILAREQFRKNPPPHLKGPQQGMLEGDFAICISLYHGYELLLQMGLRSLFFYIQGIMDGSREMSRARNELQRTPTFMDLYQEMEAVFVKPSAGPDEPFIYSHPKLQKLEEVVLQHFRSWAESSALDSVSTRVMIFSSFRESVQEIAAMLNRHTPLIRVMTFMGQASAGKGVKGFTQKEQLEVVHRFRQGGFNTLVSTCVGEEGLDIGEVDLIVCFDAQKSPIRLVQRMGRTGRKRQGRIVVILAEGREERTYNQSQSNKRSVYKSIIGNKNSFHMYPSSPRMLPEGLNPSLHKMHITCGQFDHRESGRRSVRGRRSHAEGRGSLIHPQNLVRQGSVKSDGFLSPTEFSLWASTMRLEEDQAQPTLRQSHFLSLPSDLPPQEEVSTSGPASRELSLWEWRHWQNRALPTHAVDHSPRCQHFVKVMELIDRMREEDKGECSYEQELLPHLHKADTVAHTEEGQMDKTSYRKRQKSTKTCTKTTKSKPKPPHPSVSDLECINEKGERENTRGMGLVSPLTMIKDKLPVEHDTEAPSDDIRDHSEPEAVCPFPSNNDRPVADMDDDCVMVTEEIDSPKSQSPGEDIEKTESPVSDPLNLNRISQLITKIDNSESGLDEDIELQAMFYLPKWDSAAPSPATLLPGRQREESLRVILANVAELLSRSPPSLTFDLEDSLYDPGPAAAAAAVTVTSIPPSPERAEENQGPHQPFQVNFALDVDDDDDLMMNDNDDASPRAESDVAPMDVEDSKVRHDSPRQQQLSSHSPAVSEPPVDRGGVAAVSPSWDEVFGDEALNNDHDIRDDGINEKMDDGIDSESLEEPVDGAAKKNKEMENKFDGGDEEENDSWDDVRNEEMPDLTDDGMDEETDSHPPHLHGPPHPQPPDHLQDESMDLFGDDEAFLQMTIPDIPTPEDCITPNTSPGTEHIANSAKRTPDTPHTHIPMNTLGTTHLTDSTHRLNTIHMHETANTAHITHTLHTTLTHRTTNTHNTKHCPDIKQDNTTEADILETHTAASSKHVTDNSTTDNVNTNHCVSPILQQNPESFDSSHDFFSVNFDLGYSLEDSEEDVEEEDVPAPSMAASPRAKKQEVAAASTVSLPAISGSSTPCHSFHRQSKRSSESKLSPPLTLSEHGKREMTYLLASPLTSKGGVLPSPITSLGVRRTLMPGPSGPRTPSSLFSLKRRKQEGGSAEAERRVTARQKMLGVEDSLRQESVSVLDPPPHPGDSDSEDEVVVHKRRHQTKANPLSSPEASKIFSDVDSPLLVNRKNPAALNISDETEGEAVSDDDFQNDSVSICKPAAHRPVRQRVLQGKAKVCLATGGPAGRCRHFLDEEAELSEEEEEEGAEVSSDEEDGEDQNRSLEGFVVDNTHLSQGLNDSEMHGVYMKSVRSPALAGKFKMVYKKHHNMDIFSQVPEMDETYAEDSFVVGSEVEELGSSEEEVEEDVIELIPEDSYVDGRRQYATRRRAFLHKARAKAGAGARAGAESPTEQRAPQHTAGVKTKRSRIICINDSSEEETEEVVKESGVMTKEDVAAPVRPKVVQQDPQQQKAPSSSSTIAAKVSLLSRGQSGSANEDQQNERCRQRLENQALLSDELDFEESESLLTSRKPPQARPSTSSSSSVHQPQTAVGQASSIGESPAPSGPVSILVDSRCLSSGVELMTSLRQRHAAAVHVCSLDGSYFIVSNRMAVERHSQSDLAAMQNRKRLAERVNSLQGLFERVCLVVEKDRTKPGEASRPFQRTRYYDSTVAALVRTGVRLLWSDGPEETATLLADLARLEQRKGQGIAVPLEVKGQHRQQALQFYLTLPSVSYVHALNMSHNFSSVAHLINSSIEALQKGGCMSRFRAEEIYRCLRYSCDSFLLNTSVARKSS
uniref:Fanconi anemia group M protein n=1 Tax=Centroberyx gerrardi TaxID=166262 RepID=UPI003AAB205B